MTVNYQEPLSPDQVAAIDNLLENLKTDSTLLMALKSAVKQPTPDELRDQSVSFIMGSVGFDSGVTRADVESFLSVHLGAGRNK